MKQSIGFYQFCDAFRTMDRNEKFTYQGKRALFDYLEQYEDDTGEEIELDVISLCCDYTEYSSLEEFNSEYDPAESIEEIQDRTTVIMVDDDAFIIQNY